MMMLLLIALYLEGGHAPRPLLPGTATLRLLIWIRIPVLMTMILSFYVPIANDIFNTLNVNQLNIN